MSIVRGGGLSRVADFFIAFLSQERHWDSDKLPKYIKFYFDDWKSRYKHGAPHDKPDYPMKLHRNYLDPTYCPVSWLLTYLSYAGYTEGPIFQSFATGEGRMNEREWVRAINRVYVRAGLRTNAVKARLETDERPARAAKAATGCTAHSIRRSAAQWAGRCGASTTDVRNCGRWKTLEELVQYMAQGALQREQYENDMDGDGHDPIFRMFVFKPVTEAAASGQDIM